MPPKPSTFLRTFVGQLRHKGWHALAPVGVLLAVLWYALGTYGACITGISRGAIAGD